MGFSFRDFAIRNIFTDWLALKPNAHLFIYGRTGKIARELFTDNLLKKRISARNIEFDTGVFLNTIESDILSKFPK